MDKIYVVLRKDRTILVNTPKPYIADAYTNPQRTSMEKLKDIMCELEDHTKFLYNCLKMLGISKKEAKRQEFSLNAYTGEMLYNMACHDENISHEMRMAIKNHKW